MINNTVILVKSSEHGKRVIEWFRSQGVDTKCYYGYNEYSYYGIVNEVFYYWDAKSLPKHATIIELPEPEPILQKIFNLKVTSIGDDLHTQMTFEGFNTTEMLGLLEKAKYQILENDKK